MTTPYTTGVWRNHGTDPDSGGHSTDGGRVWGISDATYAECERYGCPAVLVLNPDDAPQMVWLAKAISDHEHHDCGSLTCYSMKVTEAVRALMAGMPKPAEPTGIGAVVEDVEGDRWVRCRVRQPGLQDAVWQNVRSLSHYAYGGIDAVRVLSEGVTTDG